MSDLLKDLGQSLSEESKQQLAPEEAGQQDASELEGGILGQMIATLENVNASMVALRLDNRIMKAKVDTLENLCSYLISKVDPDLFDKMSKAQPPPQESGTNKNG